MQNTQIDYPANITLYLDESSAFNRSLLSLITKWDKGHAISIHRTKTLEHSIDKDLQVIDQNGSSFLGAEAVPIILKNLPFGKLAAAMYILPGTMWVTKQLYSMHFTH